MEWVQIGEIFTKAETDKALEIYKETGGNGGTAFIDRAVKEITEPALPRINAKTGQENHARYLAYMLEFAIVHSSLAGIAKR